MIGAYVNQDRGSTQVIGSDIPNGPATIERRITGRAPLLIRGGAFVVDNEGFSKEDAEVPFGVPLTYRVTVDPPDRLVQRNTALTPTLAYGLKGWRGGAGRILSLVANSVGASGLVAGVSANSAGASPVYPAPAVIGYVATPTAGVAGSTYSLTPSASIAVGDWVYLVHQQDAGGTAPQATGFQQVASVTTAGIVMMVWRRKRAAGDSSYTVVCNANGSKTGLLVWVRGASDLYVPTVGPVSTTVNSGTLRIGQVPTVGRPSVLLTALAATFPAGTTGHAETISGVGQSFPADAGVRHTTLGVTGMADTGLAPNTVATFPVSAVSAAAVQIAVPSDAPVTQRVIATTPVAAMMKSGKPGRVTGRLKFRTPDLWLWQDALDTGTWSALRTAKSTWRDVRSSTTSSGDDYIRLYVDLVYTYTSATGVVPGTGAVWDSYVTSVLGRSFNDSDPQIDAAVRVIRSGVATPADAALLTSQWGTLLQLLLDIHTTPTRSPYLLAGLISPTGAAATDGALQENEARWAILAASRSGLALTASDTTVPAGSTVTQTYVAPVQVIVADAARTNTWVDFSFRFTLGQDVPAGAVLRFMHGTNVREYSAAWEFDRIGVTEGQFMVDRDPLYWMSGDTPVPSQPEDYLLPDRTWSSGATDSVISWSGAPGDSVSTFLGPSRVFTEVTSRIDAPDAPAGFRVPVYLSDPIAPARGQWYELITVSDLSYTARRALLDVISRGPQIAVSSTRAWASGSVTLLTRTLAQRTLMIATMQTGRILLFRNPDPRYPEDTWYISVGDVTEQRTGGSEGDQRRGERLWQVPFVQVERPVGLIDQSAGRTWEQVRTEFTTWQDVRTFNETWLELLYPTDVVVQPVAPDPLFPGAPNAYPSLATFPSGVR